MPQEIERKFLVADDSWRGAADDGRDLVQAYFCETDRAVVRLRIVGQAAAFLTIKSAQAGMSRAEFEYSVPLDDAQILRTLCSGEVLAKRRYKVPYAGRTWEVDVYSAGNDGLVIAEIELESVTAAVDLPPWLGPEVTGQARYYASRLAREPFSSWSNEARSPTRRAGVGR